MKNKKIPKAFTLVELFVVVSVISLLTFAVVSNINRQRSHLIYDQTINEINSLIKEARNFTVTSRAVYDVNQAPGEENYIPREGYGVYIEKSDTLGESRIILFANTHTQGEGLNQYSNQDVTEEIMILPSEISFDSLELIDTGPPESATNVTRAVILFRTPLAETFIAQNDNPENLIQPATEYDTLEMKFYRTTTGIQGGLKTIFINKTAGFSEIELN